MPEQTAAGSRLDLFEPGASEPALSVQSVLSVSIGLEHTATSDMDVELPPHDGITITRFRGGNMAYYADDQLVFRAGIEGLTIADDKTLTLSGPAVEDVPLLHNEISRSFTDTTIATAIRELVEDLPYEVHIRPSQPHPVSEHTVQAADSRQAFEDLLQAGSASTYTDTSTWRDLPGPYGDDDVINTRHETTPLTVDAKGLTLTPTCAVLEAEAFETEHNISILSDAAASGFRCVELTERDEWIELSVGLDHTIPPGCAAISIRGRTASVRSAPHDKLAIGVNGSRQQTVFTGPTWGDEGYCWQHLVTLPHSLAGAAGPDDSPHTIRLEKVEGTDAVRIDCLAVHDTRFTNPPPTHATVDDNGALAEPGLYPDRCPAVFDLAPAGMRLEQATIRVRIKGSGQPRGGTCGVLVPDTGASPSGETVSSGTSDDAQEMTVVEHDIDDTAETTHLYGYVDLAGTTRTGTEKPTTTPTTRTDAQTVSTMQLTVAGDAEAIIDKREFQGTPMSILQTIHEDAGRRFVIEHGIRPDHGPPSFMSFEARDPSVIQSTDDWVVTAVSRDAEVGEYANKITVNGKNASTTVRDDDEIASLRDPPHDDGVRPLRVEDDALTTVNDCLSKARSLLREHVDADTIGGSVSTAPILPQPGPQYRTAFFGQPKGGDREQDGTRSGNEPRVDHLSALEAVTYTESAGNAKTDLEFERLSGLYRVVTQLQG